MAPEGTGKDERTGGKYILTKEEVKKILTTLRVNFSSSFKAMSKSDKEVYFELWEEGLQRVEDRFIWKALDYFVHEYSDAYAPTLGQFLGKARDFQTEYYNKHPIIRNNWEVKDVS